MPRFLAAMLIALALGACGSYGGGSSPAGGATTAAPRASDAAKTPAPSGNPDVDNYGY
jgi:hypothetical protein